MTNEVENIWKIVQGLLSKELKGPSFQTWIKPSKLISLDENKATLAVKNEFNKNFLKECYFGIIESVIERTVKRKISLEIIVKSDLLLTEFVPSIAMLENQRTNETENQKESYFDHTFRHRKDLNPSYSFETFVVGSSNQFCHAAALAIAESGSKQYNPLFIYGGVGLGKTHLTHAIANYKLEQNKNAQIKYLTSESFTNELIQSIRTDNMKNFREKYRQVDLLMIDDVQFLAGKEATQEEFFHTFNTLKENGKQIVLTADRSPSFLTSMTDRLRNRFEGGLIADIQIPDLEMRIAILSLKASEMGLELDPSTAEYIATCYPNNIRELEGALKRIYAYFSFTQEDLNVRTIKKVLSNGSESAQKMAPESLLRSVATYYNITYEDLIGTRRSSDLTSPRHIAIYLLHDFHGLSFPRIGELMSGRTHSSAIYAYQQTKKKLQNDAAFSEKVSSLKALLERRR